MFKVELYQNDRYWNKFEFEFESLEEAQQFVQSAMNHFIKEEDDAEDMVICIELRQKFTTAKEEDEEDNG